MTTIEPTHTESAYTHAQKAIGHYIRLLEGDGLTYADKRMFRLLLLRAVRMKIEAERAMQERQ